MKKVTLNLALVFLILFNFVSPVYSASTGVPVPAPVTVPPSEKTKYAVGAAVAAYMYQVSTEVVQTTQDFYTAVGVAYDALAPRARQALTDAIVSAGDGIMTLNVEARQALQQTADMVSYAIAVANGKTTKNTIIPDAPGWELIFDSTTLKYLKNFEYITFTASLTSAGARSYTYVICQNGSGAWRPVGSLVYDNVSQTVLKWRDFETEYDKQILLDAIWKAISAVSSEVYRPVHEYPKQLDSGFRAPAISANAGSVVGTLPYTLSISNGRVAVPAIPDKVVHTYPDGAKDVAFIPVYPVKDGTWVNRDGQPVSGNPVGIPVPLDPSIPWNPSKPTYKVPDGTIVTTPDGAITIPKEIDWDTPITEAPDIDVPGPGPGPKPPDGGRPPLPPFWKPWLFVIPFLDLIRAIIQYLLRMITFIITLPSISSIPIPNEAFQWFRTLRVAGFPIYDTVLNFASLILGFLLYKALRKIFNSSG